VTVIRTRSVNRLTQAGNQLERTDSDTACRLQIVAVARVGLSARTNAHINITIIIGLLKCNKLLVIIAVRITNLVVGKISYEDKMRIQTFWEIGFGYRTIVANFPEKKEA